MVSDTCLVYFRSSACNLDAAIKSLARYGLTVTRQEDDLIASQPDIPGFPNRRFRVRLTTGPEVLVEAAKVGEGTPHAAGLRECDARFEIAIDDLDAALDEINTLMEVQGALQDASQGILFLPWNGNLMGPWQG